MSTLPDTSNMVMMTVNDLVALQEKAEDKPKEYSVGDAIGGILGVALVGGGLYLACSSLNSSMSKDRQYTKDMEHEVNDLRTRLEALKQATGK